MGLAPQQEDERERIPRVHPGIAVAKDMMLIPDSPSERSHYLSFLAACLHFQTDVISDYYAPSLKNQKKMVDISLLFKIL
jgi:hypothetical protein